MYVLEPSFWVSFSIYLLFIDKKKNFSSRGELSLRLKQIQSDFLQDGTKLIGKGKNLSKFFTDEAN